MTEGNRTRHPETIDLIKTTAAHLITLQDVDSPDADTHRLRVASASLRFLLIDGNLKRAWKASGMGGPILVKAWSFKERPNADSIGFCGGGDFLPGKSFSMSQTEIVEKNLDLDTFIRSACICYKGTLITRHDLIKYIANTRGGSHYDDTRQEKFETLRLLEQPKEAGIFIAAVNERNLVHHEVASLIQSLMRSVHVRSLLTHSKFL